MKINNQFDIVTQAPPLEKINNQFNIYVTPTPTSLSVQSLFFSDSENLQSVEHIYVEPIIDSETHVSHKLPTSTSIECDHFSTNHDMI